ncbi:MAG: helix-turn-helix domain-containing protein, partial [Pseudonocardiaceae bacterium]
MTKGRQITGTERDHVAARLRDQYTQGTSIRDLMAQTGRSYDEPANDDASARPDRCSGTVTAHRRLRSCSPPPAG